MSAGDNHSKPQSVPRHVAIVMDGNGRWARNRNLPRNSGHQAGTENIRRITVRAAELGVQYLTLFAFSTENWNRPDDEVEGILHILAETIPRERDELDRQGARLQHIGELEGLEPALISSINDVIEQTRNNTRIQLTLAFNYSGRSDILKMVRNLVETHTKLDEINPELIDQHLMTASMPDPDLIVRTSGEMRISNFFLWQAAYSEWVFTPVLWPDFTEEHFDQAIAEYQARERRFGGLITRAGSESSGS